MPNIFPQIMQGAFFTKIAQKGPAMWVLHVCFLLKQKTFNFNICTLVRNQ
jgi:hypothetical protein